MVNSLNKDQVGMGKIVAFEQQRLGTDLRQCVNEAIAKVETSRMLTPFAIDGEGRKSRRGPALRLQGQWKSANHEGFLQRYAVSVQYDRAEGRFLFQDRLRLRCTGQKHFE
jgi:hypothetical protein